MIGGGGRSSLFRSLRKAGRWRDRELVLDLLAPFSSPGGGVLSSSGLQINKILLIFKARGHRGAKQCRLLKSLNLLLTFFRLSALHLRIYKVV